SQDESPARPDRCLGHGARNGRWRRPASSLRAHAGGERSPAGGESAERRDSNRRVGRWLSPRLFVARRAGAGSQGPRAARRGRGRVAGDVSAGDSVLAAAQVEPPRRRGGGHPRPERTSGADSRRKSGGAHVTEQLQQAWPKGAPKEGQIARRSRTITASDIERFTEISGDRNPIHYDAAVAAATRFGRVVGQGGGTSAGLDGVGAGDLPRP